MANVPTSKNRYEVIIEKIFKQHYEIGAKQLSFDRSEIEEVAKLLKIELPKNLGDLIYSFRYRIPLPASIRLTAEKGCEWIIEAAGRAKYSFKQVRINRIVPRPELITIKVPDSTPEIVLAERVHSPLRDFDPQMADGRRGFHVVGESGKVRRHECG